MNKKKINQHIPSPIGARLKSIAFQGWGHSETVPNQAPLLSSPLRGEGMSAASGGELYRVVDKNGLAHGYQYRINPLITG